MVWLTDRVGRRGLTLLFLAYLDAIVSLGIHSVSGNRLAQGAYRGPLAVAPLDLWAALWLLVSVVCFVQAFMRKDRAAFSAAAAIKIGWAGSYLIAWAVLGQSFAWSGASVWAAFGALVLVIAGWEENHAHCVNCHGLAGNGTDSAGLGADPGIPVDGTGGLPGLLAVDPGDRRAGGDEAAAG